jgi:hypothetical protein
MSVGDDRTPDPARVDVGEFRPHLAFLRPGRLVVVEEQVELERPQGASRGRTTLTCDERQPSFRRARKARSQASGELATAALR